MLGDERGKRRNLGRFANPLAAFNGYETAARGHRRTHIGWITAVSGIKYLFRRHIPRMAGPFALAIR
jgi:hypothetical protein